MPTIIFVRGLYFKVICLIIFISLGALKASSISEPDTKSNIFGYGKIINIPSVKKYYQEAIINIDKASQNVNSSIKIRFPLDLKLISADYLYFEGIVKSPLFYKNDNDYPVFYNNFLQKRYYLKGQRVKIIKRSLLMQKLNLWKNSLRSAFWNSNLTGKDFFMEVLFGEKRLNEKQRDIFNKTGTSHLLSISGLHFSLTVFFAYLLSLVVSYLYPRLLLIIPRPYVTLYLSIPLVFIYGFLSGLSIPAFRAFLIFLSVSIFMFFKRTVNYLSLLSLIALVFLVVNPEYLFSLSFQLSFLSVGALIIFANIYAPYIKKIESKLLKYFLGIIMGTVSITLFTMPIITNLQGKLVFSGILANILAVPIFSFCILPFLFIAIPIYHINEQLCIYFLSIPNMFFEILFYLLKNIKELFSNYHLNFYFDFKTSLFYYLIIFSLLFLKKYYKIFFIFIFLVWFVSDNKPLKNDFYAIFLDVGQGDSAILFSDDGKVVMIDCGGNIYDENIFKKAYFPFFRKYRINEIEALILSHPHPDHTLAINDLVSRIKVKKIYFLKDYSIYFEKFSENSELVYLNKPYEFNVSDLKINIIPPPYRDKEINNNSLWALVSKKNKVFIFTGDTEKRFIQEMLKYIKIPDSKEVVLKVPHHGSVSSFDEVLYKKLSPKWAVISVGRDNIWGLPSGVLLNYLKTNRIKYLRTDIEGAIKF